MHTIQNAVSIHIVWVVVTLGVLNVVSIVVASIALSRSSVVVRRFGRITGEDTGGEQALTSLLEAVDRQGREQVDLSGEVARLAAEGQQHLKRIGLVKYDAFEGVAGHQSYSLCLLDEESNGVLLSSLVGSNFSRGYAIRIDGGRAARKLGDEESQALDMALSRTHPVAG